MHWVQAGGAVVAALASWRWLVRPLRRGLREALTLLHQIRNASAGVTQLSRDVHALAGAVVQLVLAVLDETQQLRAEHEQLRAEQGAITRMVIDLEADVRRLAKKGPSS